MPSGSKRRKAAKKKKGNDPHKSSSTLQSSENDDLRNQEEKDSDGGENEVSSPVSQGNQDPFAAGGNELEEKGEDPPPVRSVASESVSLDGDDADSKDIHVVGLDSEKNGVIEIITEMKSGDAPESNSVDIVCDENLELLTNGNHEKNNGISFDGETRDLDPELVLKPETAILEAPEYDDSSPEESTEKVDSSVGIVDEVESLATASEKVIHVTEIAPTENIEDSGSDLKENGEKDLKPRDYSSDIPQTMLGISSEVEEIVWPYTVVVESLVQTDEVEPVAAVSEEVILVTETALAETILDSASDLKENGEKESVDISSYVEESVIPDSIPILESSRDKVVESIDVFSEKIIHVTETATAESMVDSGSDLKENGEKELAQSDYTSLQFSKTVEETVVPDSIAVVSESSFGFDEAALSEKVIYVTGTAPTESILDSGSSLKEDTDCSSETRETLLDISSKVQETVVPAPDESVSKLSSVAAIAIEKENRSLPISEGYTARASSSEESTKEPYSSEISESQPLVAPAPRRVEKTSWFGCCGIFDLISGTR